MVKHVIIRAVDEGKTMYATQTGWSEYPGRAFYFPYENTNFDKLANTLISRHQGAHKFSDHVKIEPVVLKTDVEDFSDDNSELTNAIRKIAVGKLSKIEIDALGLESHALFVKMGQHKKTRKRRNF